MTTTSPKSPKKSEVNENFKEILYEIKVVNAIVILNTLIVLGIIAVSILYWIVTDG